MDRQKLAETASKLFLEHSKRHVFLCTGDSCCRGNEGAKAWDALKDELKRRDLSLSDSPQACFRTKVHCLRVCTQGPILVVYPEGHWYAEMTADKIPTFVEKQLFQGEPVPEWIFATRPLPLQDPS